MTATDACAGRLVWTDYPRHDSALRCSTCGYEIRIGGFCDTAHWGRPITRPDSDLDLRYPGAS